MTDRSLRKRSVVVREGVCQLLGSVLVVSALRLQLA
jgi:hypothetical protein